jgi:multidrug efflux pump
MFTDIFIKRPVLAICINLLILVAGIQALRTINTRQFPRSDLAVVKVTTNYIGADADLVRGYITTPLEQSIASADGIDYLDSSSAQGVSTISAHLRLNFDVNAALTQIQAKVNQVRNDLPPEAEAPIIELETSDNQFASIYLSFYSDKLEQNEITDYLLRAVQPKLAAISGVQKADILGARKFAMRVWLDTSRLSALKVTPTEVRSALERNNYLSALGNTKGTVITVGIKANTDLTSEKEFSKLVVKQNGDELIRLRDVAKIELGAEDYNQDVRFDGKSATFMGVWVLPNANTLNVISAVRDSLPEIEAQLPDGLSVGVPYDSTRFIEDAIDEVIHTLGETILIVVVVIFLFIGSLRGVIVPVIAIPLSLIGAVALMYLFGFTLNQLTLLSIVLAVGLVVDDAIVMLENVERHIQLGETPINAALKAGRELAGPVIAMTITLAAVYAPIGLQGGLTGALFKEFAFTLAGAVFISGIVALTLSPYMSARLIKKEDHKSGSFKSKVDNFLDRVRIFYQNTLTKVLGLRYFVLILSAFTVVLLIPFYMFSMKELAPTEDRGVVFAILQTPPDSSLDSTTRYTEELFKIYKTFPEYKTSFQLTGPNSGFSGMLVKPFSERSRSTEDMVGEAWGKAGSIAGLQTIITTPSPLPGGSNFPIEFIISTTDSPEKLVGFAQELVQAAFASEKFIFADSNLKFDLPQSVVNLNRDQVATAGLDLSAVGEDLSILLGGNYINRFSMEGRSYKVIAQVERKSRLNPIDLLNLYVSGGNGESVKLSTLATLENRVVPRSLNRFQQLNSVLIYGGLVPGNTIDDGLKVLENKAKEILPKGYQVDYSGESRQLRLEGNKATTTLFFSIIVIYLVLAAQFESFRDPLIILFGSVPLALSGALAFVFLEATTLNVYSQVGLVTLVGLVAKNGILIVEFANELRREGRDMIEAIVEASSTRLRPILMTSFATIAGHFPLIIASGAGAESRNSIGIVLVSGMFIGTLFTLFVVPILYLFISPKNQISQKA